MLDSVRNAITNAKGSPSFVAATLKLARRYLHQAFKAFLDGERAFEMNFDAATQLVPFIVDRITNTLSESVRFEAFEMLLMFAVDGPGVLSSKEQQER